MRNKKFLYWIVLTVFCASFAEAIFSIYFFQSRIGGSAFVYYFETLWTISVNQIVSQDPVGIWRDHRKYGYAHIPGTSTAHRTAVFDVTYTIGPDGERLGTEVPDPAASVLFLGGSFTFGHGVNDAETFPQVLATNYWPNLQVINKAVTGWGTGQSYLLLKDELQKDARPKLVIYTMIPHHIKRNYISRSWVEAQARSGRAHPHFEMRDGRPEFLKLVSINDELPADSGLTRKELILSVALIRDMAELCAAENIPLVVVLLQQPYSSSFIREISSINLTLIDLSGLPLEGAGRGDPHPNSQDHERIAAAISRAIGPMIPQKE